MKSIRLLVLLLPLALVACGKSDTATAPPVLQPGETLVTLKLPGMT